MTRCEWCEDELVQDPSEPCQTCLNALVEFDQEMAAEMAELHKETRDER